MIKAPEQLLNFRVGSTSVGDNLDRAVSSGRLIKSADGTLELPANARQAVNWTYVANGPPLGCGFLMYFMFRHAYAGSVVPNGCSDCYKVKVVLRTLRELVAAWEIAKDIRCRSKWGTDIDNPYSQNIYAGYFYVSSLDAARVLSRVAREAFDKDPKLGPEIAMTIKRGCSEYEAAVGPSDRYEFTPEMAELEAYLKTRFREREPIHHGSMVVAHWIETAFRIGDDTYLDFTAGKRLREKTMTYDPA